jgi:hypothetical protein
MIYTSDDYTSMLEPFAITIFVNNREWSFTAIYDRPSQLYGDDLQLSATDPSLVCRSIDVSDIKENDTLEFDDKTFVVRDIQEDGTGITRITIRRND